MVESLDDETKKNELTRSLQLLSGVDLSEKAAYLRKRVEQVIMKVKDDILKSKPPVYVICVLDAFQEMCVATNILDLKAVLTVPMRFAEANSYREKCVKLGTSVEEAYSLDKENVFDDFYRTSVALKAAYEEMSALRCSISPVSDEALHVIADTPR